ncbi:hypothetical protein L6452_38953 [Arctium lappa]|uniref:Uncharacterized protein n=1 Tax=Arctium lappa TaxID=4217 RepID=A0ACB8XQY9_ARCLA|nr:hypothetical protein L6452_38953 [Arctium lappa]
MTITSPRKKNLIVMGEIGQISIYDALGGGAVSLPISITLHLLLYTYVYDIIAFDRFNISLPQILALVSLTISLSCRLHLSRSRSHGFSFTHDLIWICLSWQAEGIGCYRRGFKKLFLIRKAYDAFRIEVSKANDDD